MEKVCIINIIIILILLIIVTTCDIKLTDLLIFIVLFITLYNLRLYIGKYLKKRKEKKQIDLLIKKLDRCIRR